VIWRKNTARYQRKVRERVGRILAEVEEINRAEDATYEGQDLPEWGRDATVSSAQIRTVATGINEQLKEKRLPEQRRLKKKLKALRHEADQQAKYEEQQRQLGDRNSYSKTDPDATVMLTKDTQLKPAYNIQAASENGFVTGYSVSQNANDGTSFIAHMQHQQALGLPPPVRVIGDSGYGYEQNYAYLEQQRIESYLKYPDWRIERSGSAKYRFHKSRFTYDEESDSFRCPNGRRLDFVEQREELRRTGYRATVRIYRCRRCANCKSKSACTRSGGSRELQVSMKLWNYQQRMRTRLESAAGKVLRKKRGSAIETVFGDIKHNRGYRRARVRGLGKLMGEMALVFMSYNLRKLFMSQLKPATA